MNQDSDAVSEAVRQARERGAQPHVADAGSTKVATLEAIAAALSFPAWFGRNLDALHDCLTDLSWLPPGEHVLVLTGIEQLHAADPRAATGIESVLRDATTTTADRTRRFTAVLVSVKPR